MTARALTLATVFLAVSLLIPAANAAVIDGMPAINAGGNAGFYIWRDSAGTIHLWLTSGSATQAVMGGITATKPFNWVGAIATESNDTVANTAPNQANFNLHVGGSDYFDGVDVAVPAGAGLCLWTWGSFGKTIYLGAGATPVTPVGDTFDLLDNGGCVGWVKFHPGQYVTMSLEDTQADMVTAMSQPGVKGIQKRYYWRDLEPTPGNYNFSAIASDLQLAASYGKQFVMILEDKSFWSSVMPTPSYLASYTWPLSSGGYVVQRWSPYVISRLAALTYALGRQFDGNPYFEGFATEESSLGLTAAAETASGYTPEKYRDSLIQILKNARATLPTSQVFWYMNFLEGNNAYIGNIAAAIVPFKVAMGGPDVLPDDWALSNITYPYYQQFKGQLVLFGSMQYVSYGELHLNTAYPTKYWTMPELFWFARTQLNVNYVFWTHVVWPTPADSYTWLNALPVIQYNPPPFNPTPAGWW